MVQRRIATIAVTLAVLAAGEAHAQFDYGVFAGGQFAEGPVPPQTIEWSGPSTYNSTISYRATADRGMFLSRARVENTFECVCTPQLDTGSALAFVHFGPLEITGPPGQPADGVLHFTFEGAFAQAGEYPWGAGMSLQIYSPSSEYVGNLAYNSGQLAGDGVFAGHASTTVDRTIDLPFTVSEPGTWVLGIYLETRAGGTSFGSGYNMGSANFCDDLNGDGLGGLHFATNGPAVTLPEGFVANSPFFGIENNDWVGGSTVAVPTPAPAAAALSLALGSNPVRGRTVVSYTLPRDGAARVEALDLQGRVVAVLEDGWRAAGRHDVTWAPSRSIARGIYFVRLRFDGETVTRKVSLLD